MTAHPSTTITWSDLKARLMASVQDGKGWKQAKQTQLREMYEHPYMESSFYGGRGADLLEWLRNGFYSEALVGSAQNTVAPKRRPMWSEDDGDVDLGRLYGGFDDFFYATGPREGKPGMTLRVDLFFAACVSAETVHEYGAWVAGLIQTLEAQGTDLTIEIVLPVTQLWDNGPRHDVRITVKQGSELSDFTEWSALFSPMGTRVLGFTAFGVACDQIGESQSSFMSMSLDRSEYGIEFDADASVLNIHCDQRKSGFPAERMTADLKEAGVI